MAHSIAGAFKANKNDNLCTPKILVGALKPYFEKWMEQTKIDRVIGSVPCIHGKGTENYNVVSAIYREPVIWCPFDKESSEFVLFFKENFPEVNVVYSHIDDGQDFLGMESDNPEECVAPYEPEYYDLICSNPPFSRKLDVFKRLNKLGKPWVMLSNVMCLNYMEIGNYFADNPVQLLVPDKRVSFDGNPSSFCSAFFCKDFLPTRLEFCHLEHCNSGKDFIPSRMLTE